MCVVWLGGWVWAIEGGEAGDKTEDRCHVRIIQLFVVERRNGESLAHMQLRWCSPHLALARLVIGNSMISGASIKSWYLDEPRASGVELSEGSIKWVSAVTRNGASTKRAFLAPDAATYPSSTRPPLRKSGL